ncbi:MmyB family transcriptional regulator [Streptomyces lunaelactis]
MIRGVRRLAAPSSRAGPRSPTVVGEEFATLWDTHDVALRRFDHKRIVHPALGVIGLDCWNCSPSSARRTWRRARTRLSR